MIVSTCQRRTRPGLYFGSRAQRDIDDATILSDALYQVLPDRKGCIVCGRPLRRPEGAKEGRPLKKEARLTPTRDGQRRNAFHPCCSLTCRRQYQEWLNEV
ncbi:MAG: hypothetical protein ACE5IC_09030 [Candidatus Brocadiales bacterium]